MKRHFFVLLGMLCGLGSKAQFAPPAGQTGTSAIYKDSSIFVSWASSCTIIRGLQDISNDTSAYASVGDSSSAIGMAGTNGIVSLGDSGIAILAFNPPIYNGPGFDFAVFENSFSDDFLEFAFVEVSSDGVNYFRFPATCHIQDSSQTGAFGLSDATLVNNLAGKYRANYGTPFDLDELNTIMGLDLNHIGYVKIVDVVGSITSPYATHDFFGHAINDPFPTPFPSSGFDLDAVGAINTLTIGITELEATTKVCLFPNPASSILNIQIDKGIQNPVHVKIISAIGNKVLLEWNQNDVLIQKDISNLEAGVYFVEVNIEQKRFINKLIIQ